MTRCEKKNEKQVFYKTNFWCKSKKAPSYYKLAHPTYRDSTTNESVSKQFLEQQGTSVSTTNYEWAFVKHTFGKFLMNFTIKAIIRLPTYQLNKHLKC